MSSSAVAEANAAGAVAAESCAAESCAAEKTAEERAAKRRKLRYEHSKQLSQLEECLTAAYFASDLLTFQDLCSVKVLSTWCNDQFMDLHDFCDFQLRMLFESFARFRPVGLNLDFVAGLRFSRLFHLSEFEVYCGAGTRTLVVLERSRFQDLDTKDRIYGVHAPWRWKLPSDTTWAWKPDSTELRHIPVGLIFQAHMEWNISADFSPELYAAEGRFTVHSVPEHFSFFRAADDDSKIWRPAAEFDPEDEVNGDMEFEFSNIVRESPFMSFMTQILRATAGEAHWMLVDAFMRLMKSGDLEMMFPSERPRLLTRSEDCSVGELFMRTSETDQSTELLAKYFPEHIFQNPTCSKGSRNGMSQLSFAVTHVKSDDLFCKLLAGFDRVAQREAFFVACTTRLNARINLILDVLTPSVCRSFCDMLGHLASHEEIAVPMDPISLYACHVFYLAESDLEHEREDTVSMRTLQRLIHVFWKKFDYTVYDEEHFLSHSRILCPLACVAATAPDALPQLFALVESRRGSAFHFKDQLLALLSYVLYEEGESFAIDFIWEKLNRFHRPTDVEISFLLADLQNNNGNAWEDLQKYQDGSFFSDLQQNYPCLRRYMPSESSDDESFDDESSDDESFDES